VHEPVEPEPHVPSESESAEVSVATMSPEEPVATPAPEPETDAPLAAEPAAEPETAAEAEIESPATTAEAAAETAAGASDAPADARPAAGRARGAAVEPTPKQRARVAALYRALRSARDVDGTVEQVIRGGYQVRIGGVRGFCPHSQIDVHRENEPERHVGQTYRFRITQVRHGGADVVVSRRVVLLAERIEEAKAVRATLLEGAITSGRIAGTAEFGAFVDLGAGVMGLVHVSELAHHRVARVEDVVHVGDVVNVKVLKLHEDGRRISLSMREAQDDPWMSVAERFRPGNVYPGTIRRLADFGAFVELESGIEALAPSSEFPPTRGGWRADLAVDQSADWLVLGVDPEHRRVTLTVPADGLGLGAPAPEIGATLRGRVQRIEAFGVFVWLGPGRSGLVPSALSGVPRGTDLVRKFTIGDEIDVEVVEVDPEGRRIRLARKGVRATEGPRESRQAPPQMRAKPAPREQRREPAPQRNPAPAERPAPLGTVTFGTSLGDKLRAALAEPHSS
jgi:small subunit ribosomal protein S1